MNAIDTVAGSSEIFLFDIPELITKWDFVDDEFTWVRKRACLADLGDVPSEVFVDACLLAGNALLPPMPQLDPKRSVKVRNAAEMIMGMGRSGHSVCLQFQDTATMRQLNYLDRFRRAKTTIKHHVILNKDGKVEPFDAAHASGDLHEVVSQRLPEELYFYLSKGIIGPRVLNWRVHGEILEPPPLDNGESEEYRKLVRDQLIEMRTSTLALLSFSLHRVYQHRDLTLRCWFDKDKVETISMRNLDDPKPLVNGWHVPASVINLKSFPQHNFLGFAVRSLEDKDFAAKTISTKKQGHSLKGKDEVMLNSIWRFLHVRGYVDSKHNLTKWGIVLNAVMSAIPSREHEEAAVVAVELARLGLLGADYMFPTYSGLSYASSEILRRNILLVSRVASLGRLQHKQIGFTGALSRHLLGWHSMISAVRSGLRDLLEVCLVTVLLNGDADRARNDWTELGLGLPFLLDHGCAMGLAMNIYLNKVVELPEPKDEEAHQAAKENGQRSVFVHCIDFAGDIDKAFGLWDAVSLVKTDLYSCSIADMETDLRGHPSQRSAREEQETLRGGRRLAQRFEMKFLLTSISKSRLCAMFWTAIAMMPVVVVNLKG